MWPHILYMYNNIYGAPYTYNKTRMNLIQTTFFVLLCFCVLCECLINGYMNQTKTPTPSKLTILQQQSLHRIPFYKLTLPSIHNLPRRTNR